MKADIDEGRLTREVLAKMKQEAMAEKYVASRETVAKARETVLSKNVGNSDPDN